MLTTGKDACIFFREDRRAGSDDSHVGDDDKPLTGYELIDFAVTVSQNSGLNICQVLTEIPETLSLEIAGAVSRQKKREQTERIYELVTSILMALSKDPGQRFQQYAAKQGITPRGGGFSNEREREIERMTNEIIFKQKREFEQRTGMKIDGIPGLEEFEKLAQENENPDALPEMDL